MKRSLFSRFIQLLCLVCLVGIGGFALDRDAFTFVGYSLNASVIPAAHGFSAQGKITLRNDSESPQKNLSLQISSTLDWKRIRVGGKDVLFSTQPYQSDVDHTGVVNEAVIALAAPVQSKQTIEIEVSYEGAIPADSTRLTRIGTPETVALGNDWDRISADFSAVRGVGFVCWYPVSMEPANLSEGNRYFDVIGEWKRRNAGASMRLNLESIGAGAQISNGQVLSTTAHEGIGAKESTRESVFLFDPIGEFPPTFAVADFANLDRHAVTVSYVPDHKEAAEEFALDAERILPDLTDWFGQAHEKIRVVELPDPNAMPFDSGAMVFTPLRTSDTKRVEVQMAHPIAHACLPSSIARLWIGEGLAQFAQVLTRERQDGRKAALAWMNAYIPALVSAEEQALAAEPAGINRSSRSLVRATDPAFYNIKAMFVWWMLRDIVGDEALQRAVRNYDSAKDKEPATMQRLIEAQSKKDLEWFFDNWVYRDRGLPDFRIESAFSRPLLTSREPAQAGVSVTITVENVGDAAAEVPIVVHTDKGDVTSRVIVNGKSKAVQRMQVPVEPTSITVNDGSVPEANITNNVYKFPAK